MYGDRFKEPQDESTQVRDIASPLPPAAHQTTSRRMGAVAGAEEMLSVWVYWAGNCWVSGTPFDSTGRPASCQAFQPPMRARALVQPACLSSCATRALVASCGQAQ
jgi:hypothetical protein